MKKKIFVSLILFLYLVYAIIWYIRLPEFEVFQSFATSVGNFRHDDVRVIVYKNRNSEEMFKRVEDEVNKFSGAPNTQITLRLYRSKYEVRKGIEPYLIIHINYIDDTYEIIKKQKYLLILL